MDEILAALNMLKPMDFPAVELYRRRETEPPTPEELLLATRFMEDMERACHKVADLLNTIPPVPLNQVEQVEEFSL